MRDLVARLTQFLDVACGRVTGVLRLLELLAKFEKIKAVGLDLSGKYALAFAAFVRELDDVRKVYQRDRNDPPIGRNLPPIAGRIVWARQLFQRIEGPMSTMQVAAPFLFQNTDARAIVRNYNKMGTVLMEFELLFHSAWCKAVDTALAGVQASLLVRDSTGRLLVNCDPEILKLVRETT